MTHGPLTEHFLLKSGLFLLLECRLWVEETALDVLGVGRVATSADRCRLLLDGGSARGGRLLATLPVIQIGVLS